MYLFNSISSVQFTCTITVDIMYYEYKHLYCNSVIVINRVYAYVCRFRGQYQVPPIYLFLIKFPPFSFFGEKKLYILYTFPLNIFSDNLVHKLDTRQFYLNHTHLEAFPSCICNQQILLLRHGLRLLIPNSYPPPLRHVLLVFLPNPFSH